MPEHPKEYAIANAYDAYKRAKKDGEQAKFKSCRAPKQTVQFHQRNYKNCKWFRYRILYKNRRIPLPH